MVLIILIPFLKIIELEYDVAYLENTIKFDTVRPGEQWFFYWKTSAALWEGRILDFPQEQVIFIPLYWGAHADSEKDWDFGKSLPERDLLRLASLMTQHGRKFCWVLPLTPAPFFPNGGVPVSAARTLSMSKEGVHLAVLDHELNINKIYSYFAPKVFQSFKVFLEAFAQYISSNNIKAPVWGANFFYHQDEVSYSYLEDNSLAFEQGFSRYLKSSSTHPEGTDLSNTKDEFELKASYTKEVEQLFSTTAEATLSPYWMGCQKIICLGGSPKETILRSLPVGKSQLEYTRDLFRHFVNSDWISTALLTKSEKKEILGWILDEHFGKSEIDYRYRYQVNSRSLSDVFRPFGIIDIFFGKKNSHFRRLGLLTFLDSHFKWLYQEHDELPFTTEWIEENGDKIKCFNGAGLDRTTFAQLLKLFMMGQKVLLDTSELSEGLFKKLHLFLLENNIKIQSVNYMTSTQVCELGEGRLILFEGQRLMENPSKEKFWGHIFQYIGPTQPELRMDDDVFSLWRIRATHPHELSFLDVRRVNIYNPTSYKKTVNIRTNKHFAFMKMIDPTRASAKTTPDGVDVELLPNGKIALDFGHYEEI